MKYVDPVFLAYCEWAINHPYTGGLGPFPGPFQRNTNEYVTFSVGGNNEGY